MELVSIRLKKKAQNLIDIIFRNNISKRSMAQDIKEICKTEGECLSEINLEEWEWLYFNLQSPRLSLPYGK